MATYFEFLINKKKVNSKIIEFPEFNYLKHFQTFWVNDGI